MIPRRAITLRLRAIGLRVTIGLGVLILSTIAADAQQPPKAARISYLSLRSGPGALEEAFLQGLRERGYVEDQNVVIEYRWATGRTDRLPDLAEELVRLKMDVIVTSAVPVTQAARNATSGIPIVMAAVGALVVQLNPLFVGNHQRITDLAAKSRLPAIYEVRECVEAGGLMSYGPNLSELYRRAAMYVDKILKGAKPADLPDEEPTRFKLVVTLNTAKALGLTIPQSLLFRADGVI